MTYAGLVFANLARRPTRSLLTIASVAAAFALYGLTLGVAEGLRIATLERGLSTQPGVMAVAAGISGFGVLLILVLISIATAHSFRARTSELALLKALGFSSRRIFFLLLSETAFPCLSGAVLGLGGGRLLLAGLTSALPALSVVPSPVYTAPLLLSAAGLAMSLAVVSTTIATWHLLRADVVTLMRGAIPAATGTTRATTTTADPDSSGERSRPANAQYRGLSLASVGLLKQIAVVSRIGLSTLRLRLKGALLIVASCCVVVFLLLIPLTMAESIRSTLLSSGDPARVVLRSTSTVLLDNSRIPDGLEASLLDAPGIARSGTGTPLIQTEVFTWARGLIKRRDAKQNFTMLVGVGPQWAQMTPTLRLLSGRMPQPGRKEILAGAAAAEMFSSLDAGVVQLSGEPWRIVGTFQSGGWWDGYLVGNAVDVQAATRRSTGSVIRLRLSSAEAFDAFRAAVAPRLPPAITLERETDHFAGFWKRVPKHLVYITFFLASLISAGAALGTTLVMESAMEDRRREIATLRLLGFDGRAVAASVLVEGLCLAVGGAIIALLIAWLVLDGRVVAGAWGVFHLAIDYRLIALATGWGAAIAIAGTSVIVTRALKSTVLDAIHELFAVARRYRQDQRGPRARELSARRSLSGLLQTAADPQ